MPDGGSVPKGLLAPVRLDRFRHQAIDIARRDGGGERMKEEEEKTEERGDPIRVHDASLVGESVPTMIPPRDRPTRAGV